jgi:hypothetical protein
MSIVETIVISIANLLAEVLLLLFITRRVYRFSLTIYLEIKTKTSSSDNVLMD